MSTPKRHHFVPQFYLRRFSTGERFIRCLHKASRKVIPKASVKGQCAIDNFYGWQDNIEWSLGVIEARAASIFRQIDQDRALPLIGSDAWQELLIFVALQSSRTQMSGHESDGIADFYFKILHQYEAETQGIDLSKFRIGSQYPAALPMQIAMQAYPELNSLGRCLLINNSRMPFITSDNPAIYYNSRYSQIDYMGTIGLTSQGLQIFYPLSPTMMLMLYDPDSYKCPSNSSVKVLRESDVIQLNVVHYLWSGEVVFWNNAAIDSSIETMARLCDRFLPYERSVNRESEHVELETDRVGALLHTFRAHAPIEADFQFIRVNGRSRPSRSLIRGAHPETASREGRAYAFAAEAQPRSQMRGPEVSGAVRAIGKTLDVAA